MDMLVWRFQRQTLLEGIKAASRYRLSIMFDPQTAISEIDIALLRDVLRFTDILCLNRNEMEILSSRLGRISGQTDLLALGPQKVFVKCGEDGCDLIYESKLSHFPAIRFKRHQHRGCR